MTRDEMYSSALDIIYLASCAINNKIPDRDRVSKMNLSAMHAVAEWHMVDSIVAMALESADIKEPHFMRSRHVAVARNALFNNELKSLIDFLEKEKIWYVLLKGSEIKKYYPNEAMRQSCDADIFFDKSFRKEVRDYFVVHGFKIEAYGKGKHDTYVKLPVYVFEMHVELLDDRINSDFNDFYSDIKKRIIKYEESCECHFSSEDMYMHIIAHEYNHYNKGGTGLRSLMDTYVFLKHFEGKLNLDYIEETAKKLGINDFEKTNRSLAMKLFNGQKPDTEEEKMFTYILESGAYGNMENYYINSIERYNKKYRGEKHNNRIKYVFRRVFIPMDLVKTGFPFYYRHKILMPFLIIHRLGRALTTNRRRTKAELNVLKNKKFKERE